MKKAILDLGTNTFQLLIVEIQANQFQILHESSIPTHIGKGGISQGIITQQGLDRAVDSIQKMITITTQFEIEPHEILAFGCSAFRNAQNKLEVVNTLEQKTGVKVQVIDGNLEADYILKGVRAAIEFQDFPFLIMDIGGGSVEFIIANKTQVFWKQSFEIGGQRLMDAFFTEDPISASQVKKLQNELQMRLLPLTNAIHQYQVNTLVGSSGSFDTLVDIEMAGKGIEQINKVFNELSLTSFYASIDQFLTKKHDQRLQIPGMLPMRVDMIVVSSILIDFVIKSYQINKILVSHYSLKEGVAHQLANNGTL